MGANLGDVRQGLPLGPSALAVQLHHRAANDIHGFQALFADPKSCPARSGTKLCFIDTAGNRAGDFAISTLAWMVSSRAHVGALECRERFSADAAVLRLPLRRPLSRSSKKYASLWWRPTLSRNGCWSRTAPPHEAV